MPRKDTPKEPDQELLEAAVAYVRAKRAVDGRPVQKGAEFERAVKRWSASVSTLLKAADVYGAPIADVLEAAEAEAQKEKGSQ
jgi:hypothetical protein